jgi:hypothetical protein
MTRIPVEPVWSVWTAPVYDVIERRAAPWAYVSH